IVVGLFVHTYVDYASMPSFHAVRTSVATLGLRSFGAAAAFAAVLVMVRAVAADRITQVHVVAAAAAIAIAQLVYYDIAATSTFGPRLLQALIVLACVFGVARLVTLESHAMLTLGHVATAALVVLVGTQFARLTAVDYLGTLPQQTAFEAAIERARPD